MHKENSWINTKTQVITGVNKSPGSPRMWPNRAFDTGGSIDASQSVLKHKHISVAAVWLRPCVTLDFPYTSLIRFFDIQINQRTNKWVPVPEANQAIGIAWCVPMADIFQVLRTLQFSGAEQVWWCTPDVEKEPPRTHVELGLRSRLDHDALYKQFDRGRTVTEVAIELNALVATVRYVYKKWESGKPSQHTNLGRRSIDHSAVIADLRTGMTAKEIAIQHGCTPGTVHKIATTARIVLV